MLVQRGARINSTNRGDDTPLHLAAAHGHHEIVHLVSFSSVFGRFCRTRNCYIQYGRVQLLKNRADINFTNEHGNTPLHYACFWGYEAIAEELIENGALAALANKDGDTPLDKGKGTIVKHLKGVYTNVQNSLILRIDLKTTIQIVYRFVSAVRTRSYKNQF